MQVPDHTGRHRVYSQQRGRRVPVWLRPTTWILNAIIVTAAAVDLVLQAARAAQQV